MSFYSNLGGIRAWGRKLVLPISKIQKLIVECLFEKYHIKKVIDFGAGTLYWSKWFSGLLGDNGDVIPVDIIFEHTKPATPMNCISHIDQIPKESLSELSLFFCCDVLHHLSEEEWAPAKEVAYRYCDYVVIKDINCHYRFKNCMNKLHDRMINGEKIHDVDPDILLRELKNAGFEVEYRDIHKLWYPHFMIIAVRK